MNFAVAKATGQLIPQPEAVNAGRPILILTINNGAGHTRAAEAIAAAWHEANHAIPVRVVEVSEYMSPLARFTHITAYLWLVKNLPAVWDRIDRFQKRQPQTSPDWFYRHECRRLFDFARTIRPSAIIATEVGCGEIAALIKRDLNLDIPLIAVNVNYDADRAWIQPETDLFCLANESLVKPFEGLGATCEQLNAWGVPMHPDFFEADSHGRAEARLNISKQFDLDASKPLVVVAGGGEGMGKIESIVSRILGRPAGQIPQTVVLTGRNKLLKKKCESLAKTNENKARLRVLGWTEQVPELFRAADVLISKLGNTFDEAIACGLPIIALLPPPGSERVQYELLELWGIGRAVQTVQDAVQTAENLLCDPGELERMRVNSSFFRQTNAAGKLVEWLGNRLEVTQ